MAGLTMHVLGCGTMGVAVLSGVLQSLIDPLPRVPASGTTTPLEPDTDVQLSRFIATVGRPESVKRLRKMFEALGLGADRVEVWSGDRNGQAVQEADLILLACKPQLAKGLIDAIPKEALEGKLLISICAGLTIGQMQSWVPASCGVVRAMPNTPSRIRQGMTILTPVPASVHLPTIPSPTKLLHYIFDSVGRTITLEEKFFDVCTALSGSGPAFACMFLESLADGAVMCGLPRREALEMAAQMMQGSARMILETGTHPAQLRDQVTTPGGCTIAGLLCLEDGKVRSTIARTVEVAAKHASSLGQVQKK